MKAIQITNGIEIAIIPVYQESYSNPQLNKYIFAYYVTIKNNGQHTVQLLRRHWFIFSSDNILREVDGEGVIGQTPVLKPGEKFEYNSWTDMRTTIGKMYGYYTMKQLKTGTTMKIEIPVFHLIVPFKYN